MPVPPTQPSQPTEPNLLDVRPLRKPDKHPTIFAAYRSLQVGESMTLVNDHNPVHLRDEFTRDHGESYGWEYLNQEPRDWRILITKLASTPLPQMVADLAEPVEVTAPDGSTWGLTTADRDLDASLVTLEPGRVVEAGSGPDFDVLLHVVSGSGSVTTETGSFAVAAGQIVNLPKRSVRGFVAGDEGLRYLAVHRRRPDVLGLINR